MDAGGTCAAENSGWGLRAHGLSRRLTRLQVAHRRMQTHALAHVHETREEILTPLTLNSAP